MKLSTMAIRNLGRNKRRTILTGLSVAIAMMAVMFMNGFVNGLMDNLIRNVLKNDLGHINVTTKEYRAKEKFMPVSDYIQDADKVAATIGSMPGLEGKVTLVEERIRFGVLLSSGPKTKQAICVAGDPEKEKSLLMLDRNVRDGTYLSAPGDALVGAGVARDLGLKVGDTLRVVTQKADYGLGFKKFRVSGIFLTNVNSLDGSLFQVSLDDARDLLGMDGGASQIIVMLNNHKLSQRDASLVAAGLERAGFSDLSVQPWQEGGGIVALLPLIDVIYGWIYVIVAFLGAFVIANVMMMVVLERKKEIGMLKALGMPRREILYLFLLEGSMLGALGSAVGVALGYSLDLLFSVVGIDFSAAMASFSWPMDNTVYAAADPLAALGLFALGIVVAAVIAFLPSRSAARMDPIEAIRSA
ncbi:MAG TPA: FtsX-like permease family protein [Rectinemataceae bacterium]|nr:FtsX-like permease family protein [Rectinemataceae bacterium]